MAWPTSALTTYVANSTPVIKASDLNSIQTAINAAFLGTYSFKGLVVDGTGGATAAPASGISVTTGGLTLSDAASGNIASSGTGTSTFAGNVSTSGSLVSTLARSGTATPTTTVSPGSIPKEGASLGWAFVNSSAGAASLARGLNVKLVTYNSIGNVTITFSTGATTDYAHSIPIAGAFSADRSFLFSFTQESVTNNLQITVLQRTIGSTPAQADGNFWLVVFGA